MKHENLETATPSGVPGGEMTGPVAAVSTREDLTERLKELSQEICLTYWIGAIDDAIVALETNSEPKCSDHPDAPHSFNRNASTLVEYGELRRKQALEEAYKWMLDRHEAQKHRDNYMLIEANRFKKELLTLPRVEQGSVSEQVKPNGSGEVVGTVALDVVQAKDQPS